MQWKLAGDYWKVSPHLLDGDIEVIKRTASGMWVIRSDGTKWIVPYHDDREIIRADLRLVK